MSCDIAVGETEGDEFADIEEDDSRVTTQYEHTTVSPLDPLGRQNNSSSWSRSYLPILYGPPPGASAEPSNPTTPLTAHEGAQAVADFLTDDRGVRIDLETQYPISDPRMPLEHTYPTLPRTTSTETLASNWTVSYIVGMTMELNQLVQLIQTHSSLHCAEITYAEGYKQKRNGILHRFLVLELRRGDKAPVWLRMDRRVHPDTSRVGFLLASGESPAYDTAILSGDKEKLIKQAVYENRQRFETPTTLGDLGYLLQVICEELAVYMVWPANCWFFVSLVQQHLQGDDTGCFVDGSLKWGRNRSRIRSRVKERLRLIYHVPLSFNTKGILLSLGTGLTPSLQVLVSKALCQTQWIVDHDVQGISGSSSSGIEAARILDQIADGLQHSGQPLKAMQIRQQTVNISRELFRRGPRQHQRRLAAYLHSLGDLLQRIGQSHAAIGFVREAVSLWRSVYVGGGKRWKFVAALRNYGDFFRAAVHISISVFSRKLNTGTLAAKTSKKKLLPPSHQVGAHLAGSLSTLANVLHSTKKIEDACNTDEEKLLILRELYTSDPEEHRAALSVGLYSSSISLSAAGNVDAALSSVQEAVELRRELYQRDPHSHRGALAQFLNHLGYAFHGTRCFAKACAAAQEAVTLQRQLADADHGQQRATLVQYLNNLGFSLHVMQQFSDACAAHEEAVKYQRALYTEDPVSHSATLASFLNNYGWSLHAARRFAEASIHSEEAVKLQRELFQKDPSIHREALASYLDTLGTCRHGTRNFGGACAAGQEAVKLQKLLFESNPNPHRDALAEYLHNFGFSLRDAGRFSEACGALEQAVKHYDDLSEENARFYCASLLISLSLYADSLRADRRFHDAAEIGTKISQLEMASS